MNARGFTLVELLIAAVVLLVISAAAAALTESMRDAFERTVSAGDLGTRSRSFGLPLRDRSSIVQHAVAGCRITA